MKHEPYPKIPESTLHLGLSQEHLRKMFKEEWVVTEKVHGANFAIHCAQGAVHFAKRKALLEPEDNFFGYHAIRVALEQLAIAVFQQLGRDFCLYGELYGGAYPHPQVAADPRFQAVQTGVWYRPDLGFMAFDLSVNGKFLDFDQMKSVVEEAGGEVVPVLYRGKANQGFQLSTMFQTVVPLRLGLPMLEDNPAEGWVIRPASEVVVDLWNGPFRPIIKAKSMLFSEDERYHQAQPFRSGHGDDWIQELFRQELAPRITPARLASAISKVGLPGSEHREAILTEAIQDIFSETDWVNSLEEDARIRAEDYLYQRLRALYHAHYPS